MQIVIDIDETIYNSIKIGMRNRDEVENIMEQIEKGTPLPKGHGRLIDRDEFTKKIMHDNTIEDVGDVFDVLINSSTIIEADKTESEDKE